MNKIERIATIIAVILFITLLTIFITIKVKFNRTQFRIIREDVNQNISLTADNIVLYNGLAMVDITGKYKLDTSDNFDNFLKELGVNFMLRKLANSTSPTVEITKEGDEYTFKSVTAVKTSVTKFTLGKEFDEERLDGKKVKSIMVMDGNKLTQTQQDNGKVVTYVREFTDDALICTSTANNVTSVRVYKRVK